MRLNWNKIQYWTGAIILLFMLRSIMRKTQEWYANYPSSYVKIGGGYMTYNEQDGKAYFDMTNQEPIVKLTQMSLDDNNRDLQTTQSWVFGDYATPQSTYSNIMFQNPNYLNNSFRCLTVNPLNGDACKDPKKTSVNPKSPNYSQCRVSITSDPSKCAVFQYVNGEYQFKDIAQDQTRFCLRRNATTDRLDVGTCTTISKK